MANASACSSEDIEEEKLVDFICYLAGLCRTVEEINFYEQMIIFKFLKQKYHEIKNEEIGRLMVSNIKSLTEIGFELKDYYNRKEYKEYERGLDIFFSKAVFDNNEFIDMYNTCKKGKEKKGLKLN